MGMIFTGCEKENGRKQRTKKNNKKWMKEVLNKAVNSSSDECLLCVTDQFECLPQIVSKSIASIFPRLLFWLGHTSLSTSHHKSYFKIEKSLVFISLFPLALCSPKHTSTRKMGATTNCNQTHLNARNNKSNEFAVTE